MCVPLENTHKVHPSRPPRDASLMWPLTHWRLCLSSLWTSRTGLQPHKNHKMKDQQGAPHWAAKFDANSLENPNTQPYLQAGLGSRWPDTQQQWRRDNVCLTFFRLLRSPGHSFICSLMLGQQCIMNKASCWKQVLTGIEKRVSIKVLCELRGASFILNPIGITRNWFVQLLVFVKL